MNLPNKLTLLRVLAVPCLAAIWLCFPGGIARFTLWQSDFSVTRLLCLALFVLASLTDLLDGKIARKRHIVTTLGKFLDPIADKMLVNTMLILLAVSGDIPVWCVLVMVWRDLIVDAVRLLAAQKNVVIAAAFSGKMKTALQMTAIIAVLLDGFPLKGILPFLPDLLVYMATFVSLYSGFEYLMKHRQMIFESM